MTEEDRSCPRRRHMVLVSLAVLLWLSIYPAIYIAKGFAFARHFGRNGISIDVSVKLDGFGCGAQASQDALAKKIEFNEALYNEFTAKGDLYIRQEYGADEGISGFFFGIGAQMGRAP
jgi:hypothetical protein